MKMTAFFALVFASFSALGADSGLNCKMIFNGPGVAGPSAIVHGTWLATRDEFPSNMTAVEFDKKNSHTVKVWLNSDKKWEVTILDHNKNEIGMMRFPHESSMKSSFDVKVWSQGMIDPPMYDKMEVACSFTYFAG